MNVAKNSIIFKNIRIIVFNFFTPYFELEISKKKKLKKQNKIEQKKTSKLIVPQNTFQVGTYI